MTIEEAWASLQGVPSYFERDLTDEYLQVQESIESGDFDIEGLTSEQISPSLSIQFDSENHTALLASDDAQILLSAEEEETLFHILSERYEAIQRIHTDEKPFCNDLTCPCHYQAEYHLAVAGVPLIGRL